MSFKIDPTAVTLDHLRRIWAGASVRLDDASMQRVADAAASVDRIVAGGETVYGVNTGFGLLASTRIPDERLAELQTNLILSHSAGLGDPLPRHVTRLMIILKLLGLGRGYSGVRPLVIEALQALLEHDAMPLIPAQGSVGASGDLAPLAHLIAALMGKGKVDVRGDVMTADAALKALGMQPLQLGPKEGLALINGTQASTAIALDALFTGERVFASAIAAGALSVDALKGSAKPFDARLSDVRGQPGQIRVASAIRELLDGSEIIASHTRCGKVQDPYSFRCQPQVMGAALDLLEQRRAHAHHRGRRRDRQSHRLPRRGRGDLGRQFSRPAGRVRGRHHLHGALRGRLLVRTPDRRPHRPQNERSSALPDAGQRREFRPDDPAGHCRSAWSARTRSLAFPASVDSIPTSAGQEDHVSMAPIAGRKATQIARNAAGVVAVELIAAAEAVDLHAPLKTSAAAAVRSCEGSRDHRLAAPPTAIGRMTWRHFRPRCWPATSSPALTLAEVYLAPTAAR